MKAVNSSTTAVNPSKTSKSKKCKNPVLKNQSANCVSVIFLGYAYRHKGIHIRNFIVNSEIKYCILVSCLEIASNI